jgi:iron-sulfur cluster repair protein YtfE (RIC family)
MTTIDPATARHSALWDMALIHRIFRSSFDELVRLVQAVPSTDATRVDAIATHLSFMIDGLTAHHTTEDELVWPVLHERARTSAAFIERMEAQHHAMHKGLEEVQRFADVWSASPSPGSAAALAASTTSLLEVLTEHLDEEERDVVPLIAQHLSEDEWATVGRTAFDKFTPAQRFVALGQMLEVATPAEAAAMLATLPPPVRILWALIGKRRYRRYVATFRGAPAEATGP